MFLNFLGFARLSATPFAKADPDIRVPGSLFKIYNLGFRERAESLRDFPEEEEEAFANFRRTRRKGRPSDREGP